MVKDILLLKSVQRRGHSQFVINNKELSYEARLQEHNPSLPLNYWLEFLDLVFFLKCENDLVGVDLSQFATFSQGHSRQGVTWKLPEVLLC